MSFAAIMLGGLLIDLLIGWPEWLYRTVRHPVVWIGALIEALDRYFNREEMTRLQRQLRGCIAALCVIAVMTSVGVIFQSLLPNGWLGVAIGAALAWPMIALRSMYVHVAAVRLPLEAGDIAEARQQVAKIVGRDPTSLDASAIARASCESLAENTSDGIVAPLFWGVIAGLPGLFVYKAINTLDSMIGYRTPRHEAFGWASARIDDLVNLIPARMTGALFAMLSNRRKAALKVMWKDAGKHRSPNAGWPEAAMAGALDIRLSGPRIYADALSDEPWVNDGAPDPTPACLGRALALYVRAMGAMALGLLILSVL